MHIDQQWRHVGVERRAVADLLDGLSDDQWHAPSLCSRWEVADVAAHLAMLPRPPSVRELVVRGLRARGSFHRLNEQAAKDFARHGRTQLVSWIREDADSRRIPAVTNAENVLFDLLVHTQDIAVPLGIEHVPDRTATAAAADRVWTMGWPFHARRRLRGLRLVADDVKWSVGAGEEVSGSVLSLLLLLTGRNAALPELHGPGTDRLATVLRS